MCERVLSEGWSVRDAASALGISERRAYEWLRRRRSGGTLADRSSRPHRSPRQVSGEMEAQIELLRRARRTGAEIAEQLGVPRSTVYGVLKRKGLSRLSVLEPKPPVVRYERKHPGELLHVDIKKLGRFAETGHRITGNRRTRQRGIGWEHVHVCVDDASRVSYVEVLEDDTGPTAAAFVLRAITWFAERGVRTERVMTDNGPAYTSTAFRRLLSDLKVRHLLTRPYTPKTNGKAERFIQTMLRGWAYKRAYSSSQERRRWLPGWLRHYNNHRPHSSLGRKPPVSRLPQAN